jgi:hypothetical protein
MKRILAFDGGGIRGLFSLQVAARIEALLREAHGQPDLVLADAVDLFAGTSTGAIIAACLAWGASVADVEQLYLDHARAMFARQRIFGRLKAKYRADSLASVFQSYFAEADGSPALLGSARLRKLLLVVMRNASTGSPWPISSNPRATFNDLSRPDSNLRIPLWQLLRASTAAPMYFPPEEIAIGSQRFLFVDGGVTPFNNPALLAVLMATLPCYRLEWPAGREELHVVSIGTGMQRSHLPKSVAKKVYIWDEARFAVPALMQSVSTNQDVLCRVLGDCLHGADLDSEIGSLGSPSLLPDAAQRFSYVRYNIAMDSREIGQPLTRRQLALDNLAMMPRLRAIGRDYAAATVRIAHLWPRSRMAAEKHAQT